MEQLRALPTADLVRNVTTDPDAFARVDVFVMQDELARRKALPAQLAISIEQLLVELPKAYLVAIEGREDIYSLRSVTASINEKVRRGLPCMAWHYAVGGQQKGPINRNQLASLGQNGTVSPGDLVWREGMEAWVRADQIEGIIPPIVPQQQQAPAPQQPPAPRPPQPPQQPPYNPYPNHPHNPPVQPPRSGASPMLIVAAVIQFIGAPLWLIVGFAQLFTRHYSDDFLGGSFAFFLLLAALSIVEGIGYLMVKKWSLWLKVGQACCAFAYLVYRMTEAYWGEDFWLIFIFYEMLVLGLVAASYRKFQENA